MLCNHDTDFFLETITAVKGRRYNVMPPETEPIVGRNISRDDVAGFFNALKLNEQHVDLVKFVNKYQVADRDMIIEYMDLKFKKYKEIIEESVMHGLVYENIVKNEFNGWQKDYYWYFIDTGGIYVLESLKEKYKALPFTTGLGDKYKTYLKAQFLFENREYLKFKDIACCETKKGKIYRIELIENVSEKNIAEYKNTIFLVNLEALKLLNISEEVKSIAVKLNSSGNSFYDVSSKNFVNIDY
ncbi:MAG: hypothetical protein HPY89_06000 [Pelotomaculum sp.]|nr:hypothetical protein [Pelotomaculum sp.]